MIEHVLQHMFKYARNLSQSVSSSSILSLYYGFPFFYRNYTGSHVLTMYPQQSNSDVRNMT